MQNLLAKYAHLLVHYCVDIQEGEKLYVRSTTEAEPLIREIYRHALRAGAQVEVDLDFREKNRIFLQEAGEEQLKYIPLLQQEAMNTFDAYLYIRAPFNLREDQDVDTQKARIRQTAMQPVSQTYFDRTATRELKRNLCQYPTVASAQNAGMALEAYEEFIFGACKLFEDDPVAAWIEVRKKQQKIVDLLNSRTRVRYVTEGTDITFSTEGRTWINSDGQTNMPSGEVYTSPVENSVNGQVRFSFPGLYMGHEVEGVRLWVKDGYIEKWEADRGKDFLDKIFQMDGTRRFGEAAIGTNYDIDRMTRNILFDEKIGGTVHMAIGQSYQQAGGKNQSSVHWDMITEMRNGGAIYADDEKIYENGYFLI
ncbi:aminopeptidase [Flavilitoribacter nigricans]|uniref:Aminopeptidase n=1 Tax=Flavilitoribacter nigricans (strain ATCC 23147 / DSM 23189 / NBRC 102662 / NCIMB 1420 / SS-2) TaxID=1122177 RepID=A0A2D0N8P3_FLAN2|nr:aminopeptidase [Flavilitoribacter nigricans]PHN04882.1 aminopeptidase [Flavilitoribacter nigricans DSM 23189 = NBRC 102662]